MAVAPPHQFHGKDTLSYRRGWVLFPCLNSRENRCVFHHDGIVGAGFLGGILRTRPIHKNAVSVLHYLSKENQLLDFLWKSKRAMADCFRPALCLNLLARFSDIIGYLLSFCENTVLFP